MALYRAHRPATLKARLNRLERDLRPYETPAQRYSRELWTYWMATSDKAADLWVELEDRHERYGAIGTLSTSAGRDLITALVDDLYETPDAQRSNATDSDKQSRQI